MAVNKVIYGGDVLIDISDSTVTAATLAKGVVAYNAKGVKITGTMTASVAHTNRILSSVESDGTAYNGGVGYKPGYRLRSTGIEAAASGNVVSGFIPYTSGSIQLRVPNTTLNHSNNYLHVYGVDYAVIYKNAAGDAIDGSYHQLRYWCELYGASYVNEGSTLKITIPSSSLAISGIKYVRLSAYASTTISSNTFDLAIGESL